MIERGEELGVVQGHHTRPLPSCPPRSHEVGKVDASILCGPLADTPELIWVNQVMVDHVKLETI